MTEEEAKEKVCPFLPLYPNGTARDRDNYCMGSRCMMWNEELRSGNTVYIGGCGLKANMVSR